MFKKYEKIHGLHKPECDGILTVPCYIQEKIDGANVSIWLEDGVIHCGSRTRDLTLAGDGFNGFIDYVNKHEGIQSLLKDEPQFRLYGEWLVRHTIQYNELAYKQFYMFDIYDEGTETWLPIENVNAIGVIRDIKTAPLLNVYPVGTNMDEVVRLAGMSELGGKGEGVVIKPLTPFTNQFGNEVYAKYVTNEFKEDNAVCFGGNNKSSETYTEMYYIQKFVNLARVQKIFHKMESELGRLDMKHIPQVMGRVFYDIITEECWTIATEMAKSNKMFSFRQFKQLCDKKTKQVFIDLLNGTISVADQRYETETDTN
jgi:ATP-dependent RNA circularization protein (DNA/RNA ligase family)